ncbi:hypothetical protein MLD38_027074 [Melastoma candidum]|uniref:Uncharacterized protein n=1 Tax=Melastoma candidum TaxID=119954 RepID=A0ACB9P0K8_9MYRT|nr:hypothetical protein MLD38_027074 [Melastoma candidum]
MAEAKLLVLLFLLLLFLLRGGDGTMQNHACSQKKTWCVAKPSSDNVTLVGNINYACSETSCGRLLNQGGACFHPNNLWNHASVAMNLYYQANGRNTWNCHFAGSGLIVTTDPSYGDCSYAS